MSSKSHRARKWLIAMMVFAAVMVVCIVAGYDPTAAAIGLVGAILVIVGILRNAVSLE